MARLVNNRQAVNSNQSMNMGLASKCRGMSTVMTVWLSFVVVVAILAGYVGFVTYQQHIDPNRVYGKWTEIGGPEWAADQFYLSENGVKKNNRYLATFFLFDGKIVTYQSGDKTVELQIFGKSDERLRRITGGGHATSFIKEGFEHTLPKQDNVGPARRVSLAEHFQSKK
ncbi:hypothetical protein MACH09_34640 [Vibrio sp. MACH09]|uniref:DUF2850 domain-containing protein n=1 Tax=unclassified Vibrio TaxID=2614977 RepID=UPI001493923B|nr:MULTISPECIES: DUF2850 domain-containing protein [unclassified Vibrio]NOI66878.1 DUF2850 domain-containing protein [Vibrio sp. 99-8-1]GLO62956.1 hypothetical protein MACH09_34640 [Vibrio sp. MACH09]